MGHFVRLQLIASATYYVGWIALVVGAFVHLHIATKLFLAISLTKRNLFEVSIVCFVICIASELRVLASTGSEMSSAVRRAA
jgi:hypothetical protein